VVALFRRGFVSAWGTMDPKTALLPFWLLPISNFGSSLVTEFITTSHMFTLLPSLVPYRAMLAVPPPPHGFGFNPFGVGYIVRGASDPAITGHACPPRLLPGKRQVSLTNSCYETITYTTSRRTIASKVKRAPTSAIRPAPLVMTTKLMMTRMMNTTRPTA